MRLSKKAVTSLAPPFTPAQTLRLRRRRPSFREGPVRCKELLRPNGPSCSENPLPKVIPHKYHSWLTWRARNSPGCCPAFLSAAKAPVTIWPSSAISRSAGDPRQLRFQLQQEDESEPGLRSGDGHVHRSPRRCTLSRSTRHREKSLGPGHRASRHRPGLSSDLP